jgi:DNA invertase Pin-like site-specific DNA recombinase
MPRGERRIKIAASSATMLNSSTNLLILETQREDIAIAKEKRVYKGRKKKLSVEKAKELRKRIASGDSKTALAQEFGISRETLYSYAR